MKQTYLNKRRKDYITCLTGLDGYLEGMLVENDICIQPYIKRIKTIRSYLATIVRAMIEPLPIEQVRLLKRQIDNQVIQIMASSEAKAQKQECIISKEAIDGLISSAFSQCFLCELKPNEVKRCQLKKDLLEAGAICYDNGKGQYPFKRGL